MGESGSELYPVLGLLTRVSWAARESRVLSELTAIAVVKVEIALDALGKSCRAFTNHVKIKKYSCPLVSGSRKATGPGKFVMRQLGNLFWDIWSTSEANNTYKHAVNGASSCLDYAPCDARAAILNSSTINIQGVAPMHNSWRELWELSKLSMLSPIVLRFSIATADSFHGIDSYHREVPEHQELSTRSIMLSAVATIL